MRVWHILIKQMKIRSSLVEDDFLESIKYSRISNKENVKIHLPVDTLTADSFSNDANKEETHINDIKKGLMGLDIGNKREGIFSDIINNSKLILWNGPMGVFEFSNFESGTKSIAHAIKNATKNGAFSLIGGGDSVAAITKFNLADEV